MQKLRASMGDLWKGEQVDVEAVRSLQTQMDALRLQMRESRLDFRLGVHAILTPDQRTAMAEAMAKRARRKGARRGFRRGQGPDAPSEEI